MSISEGHAYWMADTLGITLYLSETEVKGSGKLKVPAFGPLNLVCPLQVELAMHRPSFDLSALLVHVRKDLYIVLMYDGDRGRMWWVDGSKVELGNPFKGVKNLSDLEKRIRPGVVRSYEYQSYHRKWFPLVDDMG